MERIRKIPDWIRFSMPSGGNYARVKKIIRENGLHTVCAEAKCPNIGECLGYGTATFLAMGPLCTRDCGYCAVTSGVPAPLDPAEPVKIASAVSAMGLTHAVITSVTRDDLPDGGAAHFARIVELLREKVPRCTIELLVPDFGNSFSSSVDTVAAARPDVINHNIEVVRPFFVKLRPRGDYDLSLKVLKRVSATSIPAKSGLMVGFGETMEEIIETMNDLRAAGCTMLTVGQYLQSHRNATKVVKYYHPDEFNEIGVKARRIGFKYVEAGPLVRSSYRAAEGIRRIRNDGCREKGGDKTAE